MAIDRISVIPYARKQAIEFFATNLRPDREAKYFFDETPVDSYTQTASRLTISTNDATRFTTGEGIICEQSNTYATVIKSVSPNTIFINDNYITLNLAQYAASSLVSGTFSVGDIIYQTGNNSAVFSANIFSARVEHWFTSNSALVVSPLHGTANSSSDKRVIHTVTTANKANLSSIQESNRFPASSVIKSATDAIKTATVAAYSHRHGVVLGSSASTVNLASTYSVTSPVTIRITEGGGLGQVSSITSMSNTVATISTPFTGLDGTSKYTLDTPIVDDNGNLAGIFHLPETPTVKFRTGERTFTITDTTTVQGTDSTMKAFAKYLASGMAVDVEARTAVRAADTTTTSESSTGQVTVNQTTTSTTSTTSAAQPGTTTTATTTQEGTGTPVVTNENRFANFSIPAFLTDFAGFGFRGDPVAQTFFTPRAGSGLFVTSVDVFFKRKPLASAEDAELPVTVRIVSTQNGYPTEKVIASATVQCYDVKTTDGVSTFPRTSNTATQTKFTFSDPVFLNPSSEYALVVYSDSPSYEVWVSELGEAIIGDTNGRRVSEQPYVGSFFRSQNASTWTPYQNEDLMFRINRAVFNKSPVTLTFGTEKLATEIAFDEIILNASELEFPRANIDHKLKTTLLQTYGTETNFRNIDPNKPFWFAEASDTVTNGKRRVIPASNTTALQTQVVIDTDDDTISPFFNAENYNILVSKNLISNGEIYATNITVTNPGHHANAANVVVTIGDSNLYANVTSAKATANVVLNASGNVTAINIINSGAGYVESPTITIGEHGRTDNATAVIVSEDSNYGGNALCRYITRKVTLADGFDSGDLRVTIRGIRPQGTHIVAYYKVQSAADSRNFTDIKWRRMYLENDFNSPDLNTAIDFKFNPSSDPRINKLSYQENNVEYPIGGTFKHFAIKIVLLAECGCVAPTVRNLRVIALPEG